jgi:signal transduction histidine kinase
MERIPLGRFARLIEAAAAVAGQVELREVLRTTVTTAIETTAARFGAIGVIGPHGVLSDFIYEGMSPEQAAIIGPPPIGKGVLGALITDPRPLLLDHITDHPSSSGFPEGHPPMESFLGVPVRSGDRVFGNLYLTEKEGGFDEEDLEAVVALAAVAGSAISATRLHDRLTLVALAEDRERIARDLHDSVIQDLFATGLGLQAVVMSLDDSDRQAKKLEDAVDRIDQAITSLRSFIFDIRSLNVSTAEPEQTIARMVQRLVAGREITTDVDVAALSSCRPAVLDDLVAIVREAVSNAVRHADPGLVTVRARSIGGDHIEVTIDDDGVGFDPATARRGMGLDNLNARVSSRDGTLEIDSGPDRGTTLTVFVPV